MLVDAYFWVGVCHWCGINCADEVLPMACLWHKDIGEFFSDTLWAKEALHGFNAAITRIRIYAYTEYKLIQIYAYTEYKLIQIKAI